MTLCELEIAHLSPPMECRSAKQKTAATPADRRHCVEWVSLPLVDHTILMTRILGPWPEVPSLGQVTLGTLESQVSSDSFIRSTASLTETLARMCYAYQQLNDIGISRVTSPRGCLNAFTDTAKNTYRNITEEGLRLIQFILRREQSFHNNGQQLSGSIEVRRSPENSRCC